MSRLFHFFAQAERAHIYPGLFDIGQALILGAFFANLAPTQWRLTINKPDRILLFMINYNLIGIFILFLMWHGRNISFSETSEPVEPPDLKRSIAFTLIIKPSSETRIFLAKIRTSKSCNIPSSEEK